MKKDQNYQLNLWKIKYDRIGKNSHLSCQFNSSYIHWVRMLRSPFDIEEIETTSESKCSRGQRTLDLRSLTTVVQMARRRWCNMSPRKVILIQLVNLKCRSKTSQWFTRNCNASSFVKKFTTLLATYFWQLFLLLICFRRCVNSSLSGSVNLLHDIESNLTGFQSCTQKWYLFWIGFLDGKAYFY